MKKTGIILVIIALITVGCGGRTNNNKQVKTDIIVSLEDSTFQNQNQNQTNKEFLITENGVDIFFIGKQIPFNDEKYSIVKELEFFEEGIEEPIYIVFKKEQKMFQIRPEYDYDTEQFTDKIGSITVFSDEFKTAEGIGIGSSIENFINIYPDFTTWYTYLGGLYVIDTEQYKRLQFLLDEKDYLKKIEFDSDLTELKISDFKSHAKIKKIRIY